MKRSDTIRIEEEVVLKMISLRLSLVHRASKNLFEMAFDSLIASGDLINPEHLTESIIWVTIVKSKKFEKCGYIEVNDKFTNNTQHSVYRLSALHPITSK